jgi:hypothetical protein
MVLFAGACGLGVALIGVISGGTTFGTSYEQARGALAGEPTSMIFFIENSLPASCR